MHIEVLVEDSSGKILLDCLLPQFFGVHGHSNTWRLHSYRGVGRIPARLNSTTDPAKRILLDQLPRLLRGYSKTPGVDAIVVVVDADTRDCKAFLEELQQLAAACGAADNTMFRLAIEEIEAWYFGDNQAILAAYPRANKTVFANYRQDSVCGTWELLADAVSPGGSAAVKKIGWPFAGSVKHEWARSIGPKMNVEKNTSPSFCKLRDGLRKLVSKT
jgi:hypothetical protein